MENCKLELLKNDFLTLLSNDREFRENIKRILDIDDLEDKLDRVGRNL